LKTKLKEAPDKRRSNCKDIAEVVAKWTGIPVMKMLQGERENCCIWKKNCISV
jgi:ATP-dependent Clp protease ATP-binding subunit ClpA